MYSDNDDRCSHRPGFPIRISPDHSLLAAPRGFSQLTTSFFAQLRLGIHTHALSSLTIKSTRHTFVSHRPFAPSACPPLFRTGNLANGTPGAAGLHQAQTQYSPTISRTGSEPAQASFFGFAFVQNLCSFNARQYSLVKDLRRSRLLRARTRKPAPLSIKDARFRTLDCSVFSGSLTDLPGWRYSILLEQR